MKYKTSGIAVVDIRGTIGGTTFGKNAGGNQCYSRSPAVNNKSTNHQRKYRGLLTLYSSQWRHLSQSQRDLWTSAAHSFPFPTNFLSTSAAHTGKSLFVRLNVNLRIVHQPSIITPPTPSFGDPVIFNQIEDSSSTVMQFSIVSSPVLRNPHGCYLVIQSSLGYSVGNTVFKNVRIVEAATVQGLSNTLTIAPPYADSFGAYPRINSRVFIRITPVDSVTGQSFQALEFSMVTT